MTTKSLAVISFVGQTLVVQLSNAKKLGGASNEEISRKYPSLVTPSGWAFAIWGVIYVWEALSCAVLPDDGLRGFVAANAFQLVWALAFARDYVGLSFLLLCGITASLFLALAEQPADTSVLVAPLSLHAGWVTVASLLNLNLLLVKLRATTAAQVFAAFATIYLGLAAAVSYGALRNQLPLYTLAIAWAFLGIFYELKAQRVPLDLSTRSALRLTAGVAGVAAASVAATLLFLSL